MEMPPFFQRKSCSTHRPEGNKQLGRDVATNLKIVLSKTKS